MTGRTQTLDQPVPFSHQHHVGGLGLDCRYCHAGVENSPVAGVPPTHTCMTCHSQLYTQTAMLAPVRESLANDTPIHWNKVNQLPDYVYFDHSIHIAKGVACATCHGDVTSMPLMRQTAPLTMDWCLDCHRNPAPNLGPVTDVFDPSPKPPADQVDARCNARPSIDRQQTSYGLLGLPPMIERAINITGSLSSGALDRRAALKLFVSGAAVALSSCGRPPQQIVPYVDLPDGVVPGVPLRFATALPLAGYGRGVIVTSVEGRPIKINGNPRHPASLGGTDIFAEAAVLSLYDPDRSKAPYSAGRIQPWSAFRQHCCRALAKAKSRQGAGSGAADRAHHLADVA